MAKLPQNIYRDFSMGSIKDSFARKFNTTYHALGAKIDGLVVNSAGHLEILKAKQGSLLDVSPKANILASFSNQMVVSQIIGSETTVIKYIICSNSFLDIFKGDGTDPVAQFKSLTTIGDTDYTFVRGLEVIGDTYYYLLSVGEVYFYAYAKLKFTDKTNNFVTDVGLIDNLSSVTTVTSKQIPTRTDNFSYAGIELLQIGDTNKIPVNTWVNVGGSDTLQTNPELPHIKLPADYVADTNKGRIYLFVPDAPVAALAPTANAIRNIIGGVADRGNTDNGDISTFSKTVGMGLDIYFDASLTTKEYYNLPDPTYRVLFDKDLFGRASGNYILTNNIISGIKVAKRRLNDSQSAPSIYEETYTAYQVVFGQYIKNGKLEGIDGLDISKLGKDQLNFVARGPGRPSWVDEFSHHTDAVNGYDFATRKFQTSARNFNISDYGNNGVKNAYIWDETFDGDSDNLSKEGWVGLMTLDGDETVQDIYFGGLDGRAVVGNSTNIQISDFKDNTKFEPIGGDGATTTPTFINPQNYKITGQVIGMLNHKLGLIIFTDVGVYNLSLNGQAFRLVKIIDNQAMQIRDFSNSAQFGDIFYLTIGNELVGLVENEAGGLSTTQEFSHAYLEKFTKTDFMFSTFNVDVVRFIVGYFDTTSQLLKFNCLSMCKETKVFATSYIESKIHKYPTNAMEIVNLYDSNIIFDNGQYYDFNGSVPQNEYVDNHSVAFPTGPKGSSDDIHGEMYFKGTTSIDTGLEFISDQDVVIPFERTKTAANSVFFNKIEFVSPSSDFEIQETLILP